MKQKKKQKKVLIKRSFIKKGCYDFMYVNMDREEVKQLIESTNDGRKRDFIFTKASVCERFKYQLNNLPRNKKLIRFSWLVIGALLSLLAKWIYSIFIKY